MYFKDCFVKKFLILNFLVNFFKFNLFDIFFSYLKIFEDILNTIILIIACATSNGGSSRIDLDEIKVCDMLFCVNKLIGI